VSPDVGIDTDRVVYATAPTVPVGDCSWCPPGDPARPANMLVTWETRFGTLITRLLGDCCVREATAHLTAASATVWIVAAAAGQPNTHRPRTNTTRNQNCADGGPR
jgi:hypothetical protein